MFILILVGPSASSGSYTPPIQISSSNEPTALGSGQSARAEIRQIIKTLAANPNMPNEMKEKLLERMKTLEQYSALTDELYKTEVTVLGGAANRAAKVNVNG